MVNRKLIFRAIILVFFAALFCSKTAYADAGIPMIFITYPAMLLALIPVILIETVVFERQVHLGYKKMAWRIGLANAASTIIGFPSTWLVWLVVEMGIGSGLFKLRIELPGGWHGILAVLLTAPWLGPAEKSGYWMVPVAAILSLLPAFFVSVWIEKSILKRLLKTIDRGTVESLTWKANIASYAILFALAFAWLIQNIFIMKPDV